MNNDIEILNCSSPIELLREQLTESGYAGSTDIPVLIYAALVTNIFARPVSLLIKGPSGSGKSFSLNSALRFVPETSYELFSGMTNKAIVYIPDLDLKHKHLIIAEAAGMADGDGRALLRQFISDDKVRYGTVESTNNGLRGTTLTSLEGPCGLVMTTTSANIHPEDENRMLSISIQDSADDIRRTLIMQAEGSTTKKVIDYTPWHKLYDYLRGNVIPVKIPYLRKIAEELPVSHDQIKRLFPQLISLIGIFALINQNRRERNADGYLIADIDDYEEVYRLVDPHISDSLSKSVPDNIRNICDAVKTLQEVNSSYKTVSFTELAIHLDRDVSVISRNAQKAISEGYLVNENPGQGREAQLRLGKRELPNASALPDPKKLLQRQTRVAPWELPAKVQNSALNS